LEKVAWLAGAEIDGRFQVFKRRSDQSAIGGMNGEICAVSHVRPTRRRNASPGTASFKLAAHGR
jgi:hypothetical protein